MVQKNAGAKSMRIKTMKSHLIATLGLAALLAIPAHAADMPLLRKAAPVVMEDPWTGLYVGVDGGWGWANSTHSTSTGNLGSFDQKGWVAGGHAGYNWRPGPVMIGVELDISGADIDGGTSAGPCGAIPSVGAGCETKLSWFYTARARLGVPYGPVMPYVTGGAMVTGLKVAEGNSPSGASPHLWGWVAGGGLEFMPLPQWTLRGEFLHADMSSNLEANDLNGGFFFGNGVTTVSEHNINIVRFGITYYLGADRGIASGVSSKY
jgi:outer membrane immunogenic protein